MITLPSSRAKSHGGTRGIDVDERIEKSGVVSGPERMIKTLGHAGAWLAKMTGSSSVRQSIDRGPRTITLDQLESTYAGAKAAADANGENVVASIFFVREQRYIQLQNRKHIREELVATYLTVGQSVRRKIASVADTIKSVVKRSRVAGSDTPSELDGSATETDTDDAAELERDTLHENGTAQSTETPRSDREATATVVDSTLPASSSLRTLRRSLLAWLSNGSLRVFTTYDESPRRVFEWWVGIIFAWTWLYYLATISRVGVASAWEVLVDQGPGFVLLSIGSFTTVIPPIPILPFGNNAVPRYAFLEDDPLITLLSGVEGLLGIPFVSLFVLTLTRSIQR